MPATVAPPIKKAAPAKAVAPKAAAAPAAPAEPSRAKAELAAAVAGTLMPRPEKGSKNQEALTSVGENQRPSGRPIGVTTGLNIAMYLCYIFIKNERWAKADKLTNDNILEALRKEFPGRETSCWKAIGAWRAKYNTGGFTRGMIPKVQSRAYDENGDVVVKAAKAPAAAA